jgi:hypothetical protein
VTTASRKIIVSPASRMFSAISFGVFWRSAPSTSAIMRSRNVSPGLDVIFTLTQSESTRVPPVTAERSPPASRITGADSPVIADSSTDATPSTTSPSPGINSPAETDTKSPGAIWIPARLDLPVGKQALRHRLRFRLAQRVRLRLAAAFRHGLGKVGKQHREPQPQRDLQIESEAAVLSTITSSTVVTTLPTSTTNITGLRIMVTGCSLTSESHAARRTIFGPTDCALISCLPYFPKRFCLPSSADVRELAPD